MGVIDLDARVKKLEQEGTGGAVIDQLESAVTAIENELTVTVTDITEDLETLPEGATVTLACIQTYGSIVLFTLEIDNPGQGSNQEIYKLPANLCPYDPSTAIFYGDTCHLESVDGETYVVGEIPAENVCIYNLMWIANPAPTPGE